MRSTSNRTMAQALAGLSPLLEYPGEELRPSIQRWQDEHGAHLPFAARRVRDFESAIEKRSLEELEEIYTRTFDLAPVCNPYISAHICGDENYERGNLMLQLAEKYQQAGFSADGELPDHLRIILRFAPHLNEEELSDLAKHCLAKPVQAMYESVKSEADNPYRCLLLSILQLVRKIS
jgi:nitrate reductase molybdenum cofactor assembly chaperone NarJ/NarW